MSFNLRKNMQGSEPTYQIYSPGSVLGLFSNALKFNATVNLIYLKGRTLVETFFQSVKVMFLSKRLNFCNFFNRIDINHMM